YAVLNEHQQRMEAAASTKAYTQQRLDSCQRLLERSRRRWGRGASVALVWPEPEPSAAELERPCRGFYESCKHDEFTIDTVQQPKEVITEKLPVNCPAKTTTTTTAAGPPAYDGFRTAREQLLLQDMQKNKQAPAAGTGAGDMMNYRKKSLGGRGRGVNAKFVPPIAQNENAPAQTAFAVPSGLAHLDALMVEQIMRESMHKYKSIAWSDVAGLEYAKSTFMETIILPLQRPDLFRGVRRPPRGVLLFGPPGTGKTLIAKCIASQSKATFFSINPSSLTSKWVGEGEKLVKTLFAVAVAHQPAVGDSSNLNHSQAINRVYLSQIIFMDEVDSLLSQRSDNEHESSRRLKNEFFIQLDGAATNEDDNIIIIGATNRPQELDEAVRRRFVRRLYVPLPAHQARQQIIEKLVQQVHHNLTAAQIQGLAELTEGYSGADMDSLCRYAAMQPLRSLSCSELEAIDAQQLPAVTMGDFMTALQHVSKSVSPEDVQRYVSWNEIYGIKH
ncbi:hypothetical protein KR222_011074, partial [Zaprionus bogoriensis]